MTDHPVGRTPGRRHRDTRDRSRGWGSARLAVPSRAAAVVLVATAVALFAGTATVARGEASLLARLLGVLGVPAQQDSARVLFPTGRGITGLALTAGCSVGPLIALFLLAAAGLCWFRPAPLRPVATAIVLLIAAFVLVNQLRLVVIAYSIRRWGTGQGYEISHVFVGSLLTTAGFIAGVYLFARALSRSRMRAAS